MATSDPHKNDGIPNNAFYLLAVGGTHLVSGYRVAAIGRSNAEAIFFRALRYYLGPTATFHDARLATLQAAADLSGYGSAVWFQVMTVGRRRRAVRCERTSERRDAAET